MRLAIGDKVKVITRKYDTSPDMRYHQFGLQGIVIKRLDRKPLMDFEYEVFLPDLNGIGSMSGNHLFMDEDLELVVDKFLPEPDMSLDDILEAQEVYANLGGNDVQGRR